MKWHKAGRRTTKLFSKICNIHGKLSIQVNYFSCYYGYFDYLLMNVPEAYS
jgi:hypothetical protein